MHTNVRLSNLYPPRLAMLATVCALVHYTRLLGLATPVVFRIMSGSQENRELHFDSTSFDPMFPSMSFLFSVLMASLQVHVATSIPFKIELDWSKVSPNADPAYRAAFDAAAMRWGNLIAGGLDTPIKVATASTQCTIDFATNDVITGVRIGVQLITIDGVGGQLGGSAPCLFRTSGLPWAGSMQLDIDDLNQMRTTGILQALILHEMGHILGIGSLWNYMGRQLVVGVGGPNPYYVGAHGVQGLADMGGSGYPLVENAGGVGVRDGHWRESEYVDELMTSYLTDPAVIISRMTAGSLVDLGYTVDMSQADVMSMPVNVPGSGIGIGIGFGLRGVAPLGSTTPSAAPTDASSAPPQRTHMQLHLPCLVTDDLGNVVSSCSLLGTAKP